MPRRIFQIVTGAKCDKTIGLQEGELGFATCEDKGLYIGVDGTPESEIRFPNQTDVENMVSKNTQSMITINISNDNWSPMSAEEIAATDPNLTVKYEAVIPNLTESKRIDIIRVPVAYVEDGQPMLWPFNFDGSCIICAIETPSIDVDVTLSMQEVTAI